MARRLMGYRRISTELWLALIEAPLTRSALKVLLIVIHFTLGYNQRKEADISLNTFQKMACLSRPAVKEALKLLHERNIVHKISEHTTRNSAWYELNIDFESWHRDKVGLPSGGKVGLPSREEVGLPSRGKETYPPDVKNLPSRGKVLTTATPHIKKEKKLLKKSNDTINNPVKNTAIGDITELSDDIEVSGNHDEDTIMNYLHSTHELCEPQDIARHTGMALDTVMATLLSLHSQRLAAVWEGKWWAAR
jgi:phage replication O-like protein O